MHLKGLKGRFFKEDFQQYLSLRSNSTCMKLAAPDLIFTMIWHCRLRGKNATRISTSTRPVDTVSVETCCFSGRAEKETTGPELRVCAGIGALVANTQSEPSRSLQPGEPQFPHPERLRITHTSPQSSSKSTLWWQSHCLSPWKVWNS